MENYFELLGIKERYDIDLNELDDAYFAQQLLFHPDRFASSSNQQKQEASSKSELINTAYYVLKAPFTRAQHIVQIHLGNIDLQYQDLELMDRVFEWHEDIASVDKKDKAMQEIKLFNEDLEERLSKAFIACDYKSAAEILQSMKFVNSLSE